VNEPPTATLDSPPASAHFAESQRLRTPPTGTQTAQAGPSSEPTPAGALPHPYTMPYGYPPLPQHYGPYPYAPFLQYPPVHLGLAPYSAVAAPGSAPTSPMKIVLPRVISLAEFCKRYGIDAEDCDRLTKLKFRPGDRCVNKLEREDWHGHAGFSKLSWDDFLVKHKQFVREIKAGNFV
jgi:hypothetical protein